MSRAILRFFALVAWPVCWQRHRGAHRRRHHADLRRVRQLPQQRCHRRQRRHLCQLFQPVAAGHQLPRSNWAVLTSAAPPPEPVDGVAVHADRPRRCGHPRRPAHRGVEADAELRARYNIDAFEAEENALFSQPLRRRRPRRALKSAARQADMPRAGFRRDDESHHGGRIPRSPSPITPGSLQRIEHRETFHDREMIDRCARSCAARSR